METIPVDIQNFAEGLWLLPEDRLLILDTGIQILDLKSHESIDVDRAELNGSPVFIFDCFSCMGGIFCNSLAGIGEQRLWRFDTDSLSFEDLGTINFGVLGEYGCVGNSPELARIVFKSGLGQGEVVRVYPWEPPFQPIYRTELMADSEFCSIGAYGFEVINHSLQLLTDNDSGSASDRITYQSVDRCIIDGITLAELSLDFVNGGMTPIDSFSIHMIGDDEDYLSFDLDSPFEIVGNNSDSVIIHNPEKLSDSLLLETLGTASLHFGSSLLLDTLALEIRIHDFLNIDAKTLIISLEGQLPCPGGTSTSQPIREITLYPNPATDLVTLPEHWRGRPSVMVGVDGRVIQTSEFGEVLELSHLPPGLYIIKVISSLGKVQMAKIVKK